MGASNGAVAGALPALGAKSHLRPASTCSSKGRARSSTSPRRSRSRAGSWRRPTGEVSDVAGAALFLCAEASKYIHGQLLAVDGGWMSRRGEEDADSQRKRLPVGPGEPRRGDAAPRPG
ncbi:SDR family oxidoreductase [Sorangium sp. So ce375]|uniref:SDR family oxidoreductase n=1 Tax=Sorangium sp. So ce375 TaxID=3133306 RepID=UPI003F5B501C